ncbi:hypothetical protein ACQKNX_03195 [Lysinibacillus sp. NPDC093712]|uniref:hypothetical protein n=1 Tax=Lysinibacillus sp. NPDC093712 TaxID=3390579 RepID=UPI003CFF12AB
MDATREVPERSEIVKYIQDTQPIREFYATEEMQSLLSAYIFNDIEKGKFEQTSEIKGEIHFTSSHDNVPMAGTMIKNEQGIWQPLFTSPFE